MLVASAADFLPAYLCHFNYQQVRKEHYPVDGQILDLEGTSKFIGQHTFFTDGDTESHGDNVTCPDDPAME